MNESSKKIEAYLFYNGSPVSFDELKKVCELDDEQLQLAITELEQHLEGGALTLVKDATTVVLATKKEMGDFITALRKEELSKDIGKAGLETLSIVLYHGPITRAEIDYIRGVNSSFILRALMVRGLVKKETRHNDARTFVYLPTLELLTHLGVPSVEALPDYASVTATLASFLNEESQDNDHDV